MPENTKLGQSETSDVGDLENAAWAVVNKARTYSLPQYEALRAAIDRLEDTLRGQFVGSHTPACIAGEIDAECPCEALNRGRSDV